MAARLGIAVRLLMSLCPGRGPVTRANYAADGARFAMWVGISAEMIRSRSATGSDSGGRGVDPVHGGRGAGTTVTSWVVSRVSGADTGAKTNRPFPAGRLGGNAPSRPHEERRERGETFSRTQDQRRDERDADVPALNQLSSQGNANTTPRIAGVGKLALKPGDGRAIGCVSRGPKPHRQGALRSGHHQGP